jgi:hypothetical protein
MREVALNLGLRVLLGIIGFAAVVASVLVAVLEVYRAIHAWPFWPVIFVVSLCLVIGCGGALLLQGAWSGRIGVRDPRGRAHRQRE